MNRAARVARVMAAQIADIHIGTLFELGDGGLADRELFSQHFLRHGARFSHFGQGHHGFERGGLLRHTHLARGRQRAGELAKRTVAWHQLRGATPRGKSSQSLSATSIVRS